MCASIVLFTALTILIAIITDAYVEVVDIEKNNPSVGVVFLIYNWVMGICKQCKQKLKIKQKLRAKEAAAPPEPEPTLKDLMAKIVALEERLVQAGAVSAPAPVEDNQTEAAWRALDPQI